MLAIALLVDSMSVVRLLPCVYVDVNRIVVGTSETIAIAKSLILEKAASGNVYVVYYRLLSGLAIVFIVKCSQ